MADKAISELNTATQIMSTDMFVLEQNGTAKKLTGQTLLNWLTKAADGHGGISSISGASTTGLKSTYRITLADTTTFDFTVTNGKGVTSMTNQGTSSSSTGKTTTWKMSFNDGTSVNIPITVGKGITSVAKTSTSGLVDTYRITYDNGTTQDFTVTNGAKGDKGTQTYVHIRYAASKPTSSNPSISSEPNNWMGTYVGTNATAPSGYGSYTWFQIKGEKGDAGNDYDHSSEYTKLQSKINEVVNTYAEYESKTKQVRDSLPSDYATELRKLAPGIHIDASGEIIAVADSADSNLVATNVYGKSVQNGAPTISAPVTIEDVENPTIRVTGKNILRFPYVVSGGTTAGITYTVNSDGTITLNGTATSTGQLSLQNKLTLNDIPNGKHIAYIATDKACKVTFRAYGLTSSTFVGVGTNNSTLDTKKFQIDDAWKETNQSGNGTILSSIIFYNGESYDNVTIKPMICVDTDEDSITWESPMRHSTVAITASLRGIPVTSGGNYTDANGQQWIADVLRVRSDGTGEIERRVGTKAVPSNVAGGTENNTNRVFFIGKGFLNNEMKPNSPAGSSAIWCNALKFDPNGNVATVADNGCYISGSSKTTIFFRNTNASSFSEALAALVDAGATFWYALATPTIEELDIDDVSKILALKSHKINTTIMTDQNAGLTVTYVADTKAYIDNKFEQLFALISES